MGIYPDASGGTIGTLLRKIQDERQNNPAATPPNTEAGNPIRNLVQPALSQVESPESSHIFATRPELTPGQPGSAPAGEATVVPPMGGPDVQAPGTVVAPIQPVASTVSATPGAGGQPGPGPVGPSSAPVQGGTPLSLATRVGTPSAVLGTSTKSVAAVPAKPAPTPTPAPSQPKSVGSTPRIGGLSLTTGLLPEAEALGSRVLGKIGGPIVGGFGLANSLLQALTGNSFLNPKKAS